VADDSQILDYPVGIDWSTVVDYGQMLGWRKMLIVDVVGGTDVEHQARQLEVFEGLESPDWRNSNAEDEVVDWSADSRVNSSLVVADVEDMDDFEQGFEVFDEIVGKGIG
jgi:hypothetical protein